ncbi:manganese/iron transport system ATP-binding protein [Comamonas sp. BIGb0124]|uniref:manganese/iron ABC transporter ATP-binding protein n=1 Tax=Comamonas sp. BIGb0124 TaxID=2485130 RepID=UPI000F463A4A|nr:manganese/iron ABC transporter ATP-binding protein [Comamonas sp. BIGb0124]ROR25236.1 manganese/iron transport system ATP-binding protein [Comamonas sp. BIGb0124]
MKHTGPSHNAAPGLPAAAQALAEESPAGLSVRGVTVTYRNGHTALQDASFEIPAGTIAALVGVNGSGKSTLFKAIMGFLRMAQGDIAVLGQSVRSAMRRNRVAYVPQSEEVDWNFPVLVEDVVMMGRYGHMGFLRMPRQADRQAVDQALERVNMTAFRHRQIGELSGGQKKRVFLARALAQDARVILLDEPFTGVDVKTEDAIIELLKVLRDEGRVMLVSTHNLGSVPEFCDRTVLLNRTVLAHGLTQEVFTRANLEKTFGGVLRHFDLPGQDGVEAGSIMGIITDDERPLVLRDGRSTIRGRAQHEQEREDADRREATENP